MAVTFYIATLGCKINQYESQAVREAWLRQGGEESDAPERADVVLVNSCAVTAKAVADLRAAVRRLRRAAPDCFLVVTGCAAEVLERELAGTPGVSAVVPQRRKDTLIRLGLSSLTAASCSAGSSAKRQEPLLPLPGLQEPAVSLDGVPEPAVPAAAKEKEATALFPPFAVSAYDRSRAVLKIQDGCSHRCTYCIVPLTRGAARSREFEEALKEAERLLAAGFREITLSGVNLRQYGRDWADRSGVPGDFWDFLGRLDAALSPLWAGKARLRISSLEPGQLGQKALDTLGASRMTAPHLHISLQSGSPAVLRRMGRGHYRPEELTDFLAGLRAIWPLFGLGADILTAFPGESEAEFEEGLAFCRNLPLSYAHVFPYSRRPGTAAASMPGHLSSGIKKERAALLRDMAREKKQAFTQSLTRHPRLQVVFEDRGEEDEEAAQKDSSSLLMGQEEDSAILARGLNEFYTECRLLPSVAGLPLPRVLTAVRPVRVRNGVLEVVCLEELGARQAEGFLPGRTERSVSS